MPAIFLDVEFTRFLTLHTANTPPNSRVYPASALMAVSTFAVANSYYQRTKLITFMQKITTFLWYNDQAEEAMNHYLSIFKNSKAGSVTRYGVGGPGPKGSVMIATFELEGQEFIALNGGPQYPLTPAISLFVKCGDQQEVDELWTKLSAGGHESQCGWLQDKFGLSWQIVPIPFLNMMGDKDSKKVQKMFKAMMQMKKMDLAKLQEAFES